MSKFLKEAFKGLSPYTPGEQPQDRKYIKLNTNESPFPPSPETIKAANGEAERLMLYPDPDHNELRKAGAAYYNIDPDEIIFVNGSDDILAFAFEAFCDKKTGAIFPDISYGFYGVFAERYNIDSIKIPLKEDFSIDINEYIGKNRTVFIANPNAPTGLTLSLDQIEKVIKGNPDNVVVIDEAYVDFGGESAVSLIHKYDNLLVTQTFSKSRSMAGARVGMGMGNKELIKDLNTIRNSTNPYNLNRMTLAAAIAAFGDDAYYKNNCKTIMETRDYTTSELRKLGFEVLDSCANFIFARTNKISGKDLFLKLRENGILVRHFDSARISDFNRITIGSREDMETLIGCVKNILETV